MVHLYPTDQGILAEPTSTLLNYYSELLGTMKVGVVQHLIGGGGGNDMVLFSLLDSLKGDEVEIYTSSKPLIRMPYPVFTIIPFKVRVFGIYQSLLSVKLPKRIEKLDYVIVLTGNKVINETNTPVYYYNQNNFGDIVNLDRSKYQKGFWKLYYYPYKKLLPHYYSMLKNSNTKFISCSQYSRNHLNKHLGIDSKVIYPPVNIRDCHKIAKENVILCVSRISREKNLEQSVRIINGTKYRGIIAGSVKDESYLSSLKQTAMNVVFHTNLTHHDILEEYSKARVYLHSGQETFGITTIEAMASGCIPVVPNNSAHSETVPFKELRYDSVNDARDIINRIMAGKYDSLIPDIINHTVQFDEPRFQRQFKDMVMEIVQ